MATGSEQANSDVTGCPADDPIVQPLRFRNLTVKNRLFRSNISGRVDNHDGSGNPVNDLPNPFAAGHDSAPPPCTYCNTCLVNTVANPLGCYDERRLDSRQEMIQQVLSVYQPSQTWQ